MVVSITVLMILVWVTVGLAVTLLFVLFLSHLKDDRQAHSGLYKRLDNVEQSVEHVIGSRHD